MTTKHDRRPFNARDAKQLLIAFLFGAAIAYICAKEFSWGYAQGRQEGQRACEPPVLTSPANNL